MEAGDGRRAQTVYLKPKKKVPAPELASLAHPLPPTPPSPPTFPQVRLHSCPPGSQRARQTAALGFPEELFWASPPSQTAEGDRSPLPLECWAVSRASKVGVYRREGR